MSNRHLFVDENTARLLVVAVQLKTTEYVAFYDRSKPLCTNVVGTAYHPTFSKDSLKAGIVK